MLLLLVDRKRPNSRPQFRKPPLLMPREQPSPHATLCPAQVTGVGNFSCPVVLPNGDADCDVSGLSAGSSYEVRAARALTLLLSPGSGCEG